MGVLGFEPRTSALSELRSSQLSYTPAVPIKEKSQTRLGLALSAGFMQDRALPLVTDNRDPDGHERYPSSGSVQPPKGKRSQGNHRCGPRGCQPKIAPARVFSPVSVRLL